MAAGWHWIGSTSCPQEGHDQEGKVADCRHFFSSKWVLLGEWPFGHSLPSLSWRMRQVFLGGSVVRDYQLPPLPHGSAATETLSASRAEAWNQLGQHLNPSSATFSAGWPRCIRQGQVRRQEPHQLFSFLYLFKIYLFIYLFLAVLGLPCCAQAFSSGSEWGLLFIAVCGPLIAVASLIAEHRLQVRGLQ